MKKIKRLIILATIFTMYFVSCNSPSDIVEVENSDSLINDVIINNNNDSVTQNVVSDTLLTSKNSTNETIIKEVNKPKVLIYNFYATNRCVSCIAIEEATKKTLDKYFNSELKNGTIKLNVLCVDDEANTKLAEKYEAFGSALFVTRVYKGKETTTDLTGDGFKYAKNKQDRFIEILKNKITEYLK